MLPDPSNSYGGEIDENPDYPRAHGRQEPIRRGGHARTRGERFFTKRAADKRARRLWGNPNVYGVGYNARRLEERR